MIKVSVIIAVYQAEQYLDRCVQSILKQTLSDFELLLVDDGSLDNSGSLCDQYEKQDDRVKVFHNPHQGVSKTRQTGLENAKGEYIIHVDPDDWVDLDYLKSLYECAESNKCDVVVCDMWYVYKNKMDYVKGLMGGISRCNLIDDILSDKVCGGSCNKLVKTSLFKKYSIGFLPDLDFLEHSCLMCELLLNPIKLMYLPKPMYYYDRHTNDNSIVRKKSNVHLRSFQAVLNLLEPKLLEQGLEHSVFAIKARAKEAAFITDGMTNKRFRMLYKEINGRYIKENLFSKSLRSKFVIMAVLFWYKPVFLLYLLLKTRKQV